MVQETDAVGGVKTAAYDYLGNVTGGLTKAGETITNTYNDWNLPVLQSVTSTNPDTGQTQTDSRSYTYDNLGRKTSATNETGTATYEYDGFGRLIKETDVTGAVKEYTYDENGNRLTFKLTIDGTQQMNATYTYDKLNQLTSVTIGGDTTTYGYDDNGNILNKTTGELVTAYTYNNGNMLTEMETTHPDQSGAVSSYTATYYVDGNVKYKREDLQEMNYYYDGLNRIYMEQNNDGSIEYMYDAYNNIIEKVYANARDGLYFLYDYEYNANNQLVLETEEERDINNEPGVQTNTWYGHDANGNITYQIQNYQSTFERASNQGLRIGLLGEDKPAEGAVKCYTYNGFGQQTKAIVNDKVAEYAYNPDGLRVSKAVNGETTTHILDGANVVADIQGTSISKYNRGRGLISIEQGADKGYYVFNGHGDITSIVDGSGTKSKGYCFSAYGENMLETGSGQFANPFGYAGEYTDEETGNIYLRARYYDPSTGRFLSEDPIKDGDNWYTYAGNNPVLYIDPWGLWMPGDEKLDQLSQFVIQYYTRVWENTRSEEEKNAAHNAAEAIRQGAQVNGICYDDMVHYIQKGYAICQWVDIVIIESYGNPNPLTQDEALERALELEKNGLPVRYKDAPILEPGDINYKTLYEVLATYGPQRAMYKPMSGSPHSVVLAGVIEVNGEVFTVNPNDVSALGTTNWASYGPLTQGGKFSVMTLDEFMTQYAEDTGYNYNFEKISVDDYRVVQGG